ncbi:MAG: phosphotransferase [Spirochaetes bacterium]|nr:phosphotransferase [Spirochaetota bacterium]
MRGRYLGHLSHSDPLYGYIQGHIAPQLGFNFPGAVYRVFKFTCSQAVYLYEEQQGRVRIVVKFHEQHLQARPLLRQNTGEKEYCDLLYLRSLGFTSTPHYVVRPLGYNPGIGNALLVEYLEGDQLCSVINDAILQGNRDRLYRKLGALAHFLATLHNRTAGDWRVNHQETHDYAGKLIHSLVTKRGMGPADSGELYFLRDEWRAKSCMWEDRAVLVHGDATPSNFLFGRGRHTMAIDFERMKWADRVFDLGRLCGELKHFFFLATGDAHAAEPFIGHFLWEYCCHFPDRMSAFRAITRRTPFHMGITLLRIARNSWIDWEYRWRLVREAKAILRALP